LPGNTEAVMNNELIELVLPRLAQRLHQQLKRYQAGELDQDGFTRDFEDLLQRQYAWLAKRGVSEPEAAVAIHSAVLVLSGPGLRAEAEQLNLPLEVVEFRAVRTAAADIAANYGVSQKRALRQISAILAQYGD
jgi:hypothetical protein